jgi:hypothetical protein
MFPMKYYEYLAAGVPVVSTPLDFLETKSEWVLIGDASKQYVEAIKIQLSKRASSDPCNIHSLIGPNNWNARLEKMLEKL